MFVFVFERTSSPAAGAHVHGDDDGLPCAVAHAPDENEDAQPCAAAHALGENEDSLPCAVAHAHDDNDGTLIFPFKNHHALPCAVAQAHDDDALPLHTLISSTSSQTCTIL